jgi:hypothetical protein
VKRLVIPAHAGSQESRVDSRLRGSDHDTPLRSVVKVKRRARLAVEIAVVLVVKFCALWLIWWVWFSDSAEQGMDGERVGTVIYSSPQGAHSARKDK